MNQLLVILALIAIGYVLYRSVVIKRKTDSTEQPPNESQLNNVRSTPADSKPVAEKKVPEPAVEPAVKSATAAGQPDQVGKEAEQEVQQAVAKAAEKAHIEKAAQATKSNLEKQVSSGQPGNRAPQPPEAVRNQASALAETNDALARHRLYQQIVEQCYRERSDDAAKIALTHYASAHISEFDKIKGPLKKQNGGKLPQVATFKHYSSVLVEQGQYEEAIVVCRKALEYGLKDGTKTGYQGRIERIEAKLPKS